MVAEGYQGAAVGRHGVIGEEAAHNLPKPQSLFCNWLVPALSQLLLQFTELRLHPVPPGLPAEQEFALFRPSTDERKPQKSEGLRFSKSAHLPLTRCKAPEKIRRVLDGFSDNENSCKRSRVAC